MRDTLDRLVKSRETGGVRAILESFSPVSHQSGYAINTRWQESVDQCGSPSSSDDISRGGPYRFSTPAGIKLAIRPPFLQDFVVHRNNIGKVDL